MNIWLEKYEMAKQYFEHHGNLDIPLNFKTVNGYEYDEKGVKLGIWVLAQKLADLSSEQIEKLKQIGLKFNKTNEKNVESRISTKLLILIQRRIKYGVIKEDENINNFLKSVFNNRVDNRLSKYLYNYLYQNRDYTKMNIRYYDNKIYIIGKNEDFDSIYTVINVDGVIGDIKRESICVKRTGDNSRVIKSLIYSTSTAIDLVVLNTNYKEYNHVTLDNIIKNEKSRNDYNMMGFFNGNKYPIYDTVNVADETLVNDSVIRNGMLVYFDKEMDKIKPVNYTSDTTKMINDLREIDVYIDKQLLKKISDNDNTVYDKNFIDNNLLKDKNILYFMKKLNNNYRHNEETAERKKGL